VIGSEATKENEDPARVLIVDDEPAIRRMIAKILSADGSWEFHEAESGEQALELLGEHEFDIVITDLNMPKGISGLDLMEWSGAGEPGPIWIILSGYASFDTAVRAIHLGAFDFIRKPLESPAVLRLTVRNALEKRRWQQEREDLSEQLHRSNQQLQDQVEQLEAACRLLSNQAETIADDLSRAERIQHALLPHAVPELPGFSVSALYRPSQGVGGDLYDIVRLDDHRVGFAIADAAGHGVSAAMLAVLFKLRLRQIAEAERPMRPHAVLEYINDFLAEECVSSGLFITAAYGIVDTEAQEITFASAGHPPLILQHPDGKSEMLLPTGPALGLTRNSAYAESRVRFERGDRLLCYTDGIYDSWANASTPPSDALLAMLEDTPANDSEALNCLLSESCRRRQTLAARDDVTLLMISAGDTASHLDNSPPAPSPPDREATNAPFASILVGTDDTGTTLCVEGRGDWTYCTTLLEQAESTLDAGSPLTVDLAGCTYLDSTFLGTLHEIVVHGDESGTLVRIQGANAQLRESFDELGMEQVLSRIDPTTHPLPSRMTPLAHNNKVSRANRDRLLRAHQALSALSETNRSQFIQLLNSLEGETQH